MKLSKDTLNILKNFTSLNNSMLFKPGNTIATVSSSKTVFAKAVVAEEFEKQFGIYNLGEFLNIIMLNDDSELNFKENHVEIVGGGQKTKYVYSAPSLIVSPPDKQIKLPAVDVAFTLPESALNKAFKTLGILGLPNIGVVNDDGKLKLRVSDPDPEKASSGTVSDVVTLGDLEGDAANFSIHFKAENLKLYPGDYDVEISSKGISKFKNKSVNIEYMIAVERSSSYN